MTRREILDVLDPWRRSTYSGLDRAVALTLHHGWNVKSCNHIDDAAAFPDSRTIKTAPIDGDEAFAMFLHEGGHIEAPDGALPPPNLQAEFAAWRWAIASAGRRWNSAMTAYMGECLFTYHVTILKTYEELLQLEAVVALGVEQARQIVRIAR